MSFLLTYQHRETPSRIGQLEAGSPPKSAPPQPSSGRVPSLDGLRALAMLGVVMVHLEGTRGLPGRLGAGLAGSPFDIEQLRVRVFFILSGFLITTILMRELARDGSVRLSRFYFRRLLRIVPPLAVFLAAIAAGRATGVLEVTRLDLIHAATFTSNYFVERSWNVGHLWALAVEEQFYLLWPPALVLAGALVGRRIAIAALCLVPALRVALSMFAPDYRLLIMTSFETSADALAVGCLLALERDRLYAIPWLRRVINSRWILPALFLGGVVVSARYRPALLIGIPLQNVAIGLAVERCTRRPEGIFGRFLQWPVLVFIATASYSLYLWQQIFLNRHSDAPWAAFPLNLVLVAVFGLASHFLIERPVLRWRPVLERRLFDTRRRRREVPGEAASAPMHPVAVSAAMPSPAIGDTLGR